MRFFAAPEQITKNHTTQIAQITIVGEDIDYMRNVLRLKPGEQVIICDGMGTDYVCVLESLTKERALCRALSFSKNTNELPFAITLYQGLPKNPKTDIIIQKAVELGVYQIVFVETSRSVAKIKDTEKKINRFQKIARAAAMQSQRGIVPKIGITNFACATENIKGLGLIAHEKESNTTLRQAFSVGGIYERKFSESHCKDIALFIGPEGGFSEEEIDKATAAKIIPFTLGPRILRTETAAITATAIITYELGFFDMHGEK
ncbi:MAG: 16S rRNA (uracil(1498)-N(3))-methyltransferase [Defluviitaleaceae bacterium]|nr:16S rRNA (uracil(1498)-N(3))-methyltransferase [Defluviitaleaceae bacterium]